MKLSTYTITVPDYPEPGSYLVYNALTESMVVINQELKDTLDCLDHPTDLTAEAREFLTTLIKLGIVVEDFIDEKKLVTHMFDRGKHRTENLSIMICPTYYCNFKCVYCCEETVKEQEIYMTDETAGAALDWVKTLVEALRPRTLSVRFYGGEPLLNVPMMETVSKALFEYAHEKDIRFVVGITTNGALLTEKVVDRLTPYGLRYVKITLDGDKEAHDKKRPYLSGKGSFDRIIKNIHCTYVPMCGSGCRYEAYLKTGDIFAPDCEKEFFERTVPELIKFDYEADQRGKMVEGPEFEERSFSE